MTTFVVTTLVDEDDAGATIVAPGGAGLSLREAIELANASAGADTIRFTDGLTGTIRLDGGDGVGGTVGGTLSIIEAATIDGDGRILITGDVANDDTTVGTTDVTNIFATAGSELDDNVRIFIATADLALHGLTLTGGVTSGGGGAVASGASVTLTDTTVSGNSAGGTGGGIYAASGTATLTNSTVSGNSAGLDGGGIIASDATLTNSTVSGNSAGSGSGGGYTGYTATLINSTVTGNSAGITGGGIAATVIDLTNSIVLGNDATLSHEINTTTITLAGGNIVGTNVFQGSIDVGDTSATQVFAATVDIGGGVLAGVLANNGGPVQTIALHLDAANPALDASSPTALTADARGTAYVDQVSVANGNGSAADLGAFEAAELPSLVVTTLTDVVDAFDGLTSLREAIAFANSHVGANTITFADGLTGTIRLDGGDGVGGTAGGRLSIAETLTIDGDGRILITGDVANDDTTVGTTDVTDIFASAAASTLADNVQIFRATADLTLNGLTLTGGVAGSFGSGGAVLSTASAVMLTDTTVSGNSAGGTGGGIYAASGTATLTNSTVSGNSADYGGGIYAGTATLTDTTVSGNSAGIDGGGIHASTATLTNSTVSGNSATVDGGGVWASFGANLTNSIVLGNDAFSAAGGEVSGTVSLAGGNIVGTNVFQGSIDVGDTSAAQVFAATVDIGGGVFAGVLANNGGPVQTIALNLGVSNPALDASSPTALTADARGTAYVDQVSVANGNGSAADLGAFEAAELPSLAVTTLTDVVDAFDGLTSLREAVAFANSHAGADTITFAAGLAGTIRLDGGDGVGGTAGGTLSIAETLTIEGAGRILITGDVAGDDIKGAGDVTDIFASTAATKLADNVRIFIATADLALHGLTLTGGVTSGSGGAVASGASVTLTDTTISGNSANTEGGGIWTLAFNGTFPKVSLTNSTVSGNYAGGNGGGIRAVTATLTNSTVTGNSADDVGGGIWVGTATLTNSIVLGNYARNFGDGVFNNPFNLPGGGTTVNLTGGNIVGTRVFQGSTNVSNTSATEVFAATVAITGGVLAGVLADNGGPVQTIALKASVTNPALDAADGSAPATDARGDARVDQPAVPNTNGSTADLGAFEAAFINNPATIAFANIHAPIAENASTKLPIKIADIVITDIDGGNNLLTLSGADAALFQLIGGDLFLKAGAKLDFETNAKLDVTVNVNDPSIGGAVDAQRSLSIAVRDVIENLTGTPLADRLIGTNNYETISGLGGNDLIYGLGGNDRIIGGLGVDRLTGGAGADMFVFNSILDSGPGQSGLVNGVLRPVSGQGLRDVITDFTHGVDKINLSAIDANLGMAGNQAFTWRGTGNFSRHSGELIERLYNPAGTANDKTIIYGDINGDARADFQIELSGIKTITVSDLLL